MLTLRSQISICVSLIAANITADMGDQSMSSTAFYGVTRSFRDHSFSTFAKLFEKLLFFTPDTHTYVCIEEG